MKPERETVSLVGSLNLARAHLYLIKTDASPYIDPSIQEIDASICTFLEHLYDLYEEGAFENIEKLAWSSILNDAESLQVH